MNRFIKALLKILAGVPVLAVCFYVASDIVVAKAEPLTITAAVPGNIDGQGRRYYKFNQILRNGNFDDTQYWGGWECTFTINQHVASVIRTSYRTGTFYNYTDGMIANHKYIAVAYVQKTVATDSITFLIENTSARTDAVAVDSTSWQRVACFGTATQSQAYSIAFIAAPNITFKVKCAALVDLTKMYGAGYEPTTIEQMYPFFQDTYSTQEGVYNYYDYEPNGINLPLDPRFSWQEATREGAEYDAGYTDAIQYAHNNLYDITLGGVRYLYSNSQPYSAGYSANPGYQQGVTDATNLYSGSLIGNIFSSIGNLLTIQLLPGLSIGVICAVPVVLGLLLFIIKIIRK